MLPGSNSERLGLPSRSATNVFATRHSCGRTDRNGLPRAGSLALNNAPLKPWCQRPVAAGNAAFPDDDHVGAMCIATLPRWPHHRGFRLSRSDARRALTAVRPGALAGARARPMSSPLPRESPRRSPAWELDHGENRTSGGGAVRAGEVHHRELRSLPREPTATAP